LIRSNQDVSFSCCLSWTEISTNFRLCGIFSNLLNVLYFFLQHQIQGFLTSMLVLMISVNYWSLYGHPFCFSHRSWHFSFNRLWLSMSLIFSWTHMPFLEIIDTIDTSLLKSVRLTSLTNYDICEWVRVQIIICISRAD
jgi:hypothetical protein